jgi:hypothetical protein
MISNGDEEDRDPARAKATTVVPFPFSRTAPASEGFDPDQPMIYGAMAKAMGLPREQTTGHWCSFCQQIWFGYLLEVACPRCGNRHG